MKVRIVRIPKFKGRVNRHCYWLVMSGKKVLTRVESMKYALTLVTNNGWVLEPNI